MTKATPATPHTPGPWETVGSTHIAKCGTDWAHIAIVCSPRGPNGDDDPAATRATAVELGEPRFHEACANARLIASAPDLLRQNEELRSERPQLGTCREVSFLHEKDKHAWAHGFDPETDKQVCVEWRPAAERPGKYPIDRPCSACSADPEMERHDHTPPFRKGYGPPAERPCEKGSDGESQPMPECSHGKMMIEPCEPCGRAPVDIDGEALVAMREAQPLPKVSSLCQQTHHDFCAIPNCGCPCHVKEAQPLPKEKL